MASCSCGLLHSVCLTNSSHRCSARLHQSHSSQLPGRETPFWGEASKKMGNSFHLVTNKGQTIYEYIFINIWPNKYILTIISSVGLLNLINSLSISLVWLLNSNSKLYLLLYYYYMSIWECECYHVIYLTCVWKCVDCWSLCVRREQIQKCPSDVGGGTFVRDPVVSIIKQGDLITWEKFDRRGLNKILKYLCMISITRLKFHFTESRWLLPRLHATERTLGSQCNTNEMKEQTENTARAFENVYF